MLYSGMANDSALYTFSVSLSDTTHNIFEDFTLRLAKNSGEDLEILTCRVMAFCLEYGEGLEFSKGLEDSNAPAIWKHDLTGVVTDWIEVGTPTAARLHKAAKTGANVKIYAHQDPKIVLEIIKGEKVHKAKEITLVSFDDAFFESLAGGTEPKNTWELMLSEGTVYLKANNQDFQSALTSQKLSAF